MADSAPAPVPVDYDPFAAKAIPVDHDPFGSDRPPEELIAVAGSLRFEAPKGIRAEWTELWQSTVLWISSRSIPV